MCIYYIMHSRRQNVKSYIFPSNSLKYNWPVRRIYVNFKINKNNNKIIQNRTT